MQAWAQAASTSEVDPDAISALHKMGTYLRSLKAYQVDATTTTDDVLDNGQLVQRDTKINFLARVPDGLRVDISSSSKNRLYLYDGKNFTIFAERADFYATVPAPPKLGRSRRCAG